MAWVVQLLTQSDSVILAMIDASLVRRRLKERVIFKGDLLFIVEVPPLGLRNLNSFLQWPRELLDRIIRSLLIPHETDESKCSIPFQCPGPNRPIVWRPTYANGKII